MRDETLKILEHMHDELVDIEWVEDDVTLRLLINYMSIVIEDEHRMRREAAEAHA